MAEVGIWRKNKKWSRRIGADGLRREEAGGMPGGAHGAGRLRERPSSYGRMTINCKFFRGGLGRINSVGGGMRRGGEVVK